MFHSPHLDIFLCSSAQPPAGEYIAWQFYLGHIHNIVFHFTYLHIFLCSPAQPPAGAAVQAGERAETGEAGGRGGQGGGSGESPLTSNRYCKIFVREIFIGYFRAFEVNFC